MVGLRTGRERSRDFVAGGVSNNCPGSVRDFAQSYLYGSLGYGLPQAFGSDLNGFIQQMRPRFFDASHPKYDDDRWACGEGLQGLSAETTLRHNLQAQQGDRGTNGTGSAFDLTGLGHVGQLPNVVEDLQQIGVDTAELESSAQSFIEMWFRAYTGIGRGQRENCIDRRDITLGPATGGPLTPACP